MRVLCAAVAAVMAFGSSAWAFCGFYVATEDQPLVNRASRVVLLHEGGHTVVTMASDVHGDPKQFALVIPVPTVIRREQVRIVKPEIVEHLADYTKPRLVKYFDDDPCAPPRPLMPTMAMPIPSMMAGRNVRGLTPTVTVEAAFSVAEYDIKVLAAADSDGLIDWLNANGYRMPQQAGPVIGSYLRQHMHFFVAKVNLERMTDNPTGFLRPIRVDYDTPKFMLPIRLGTVNAQGPQDMIVLALTHSGRVETTNYRTIKMPTGMNVPEYIEDKFGAFYDAVFARQAASAGDAAVFEEYAWPIAPSGILCDPCSAPPLSSAEFDELGAAAPRALPSRNLPFIDNPLFVTRLHVRYDAAHFPEDLQFQETPDQESYQARYVLQVAWKSRNRSACAAGIRYRDSLRDRWRAENATLAALTGWDPTEIGEAMADHWDHRREN
jgi:hypothetical protein